jgi:hypothetical protein
MDNTVYAVGLACLYPDFREDFFQNPNQACQERFLSLDEKQVAALELVAADESLKGAMEELGNTIKFSVGCPEPPCPWGSFSMVPLRPS